MSDFVLVPLFGFTLVIKLRNFNFESHCNTVIFFDKKMMSDLIMSCQTVSDLVDKLHCLSRILAISWELQILNFFWNSLLYVVNCMLLSCHICVSQWIHILQLPECQGTQNRHNIWSLSDCNGTRTHNHLVHKWTFNHLAKQAKWLSCVVGTYLYCTFDCMLLSCQICGLEWIYTLWLSECQGTPCSKQAWHFFFEVF